MIFDHFEGKFLVKNGKKCFKNKITQLKLQRNSRVFEIPNESDMCRFVYKLFVRVKKSPFYFQPRGDLKKNSF